MEISEVLRVCCLKTSEILNECFIFPSFPQQKTRSRLWLACWAVLAILVISPFYETPPTLIASIMKVLAHLEIGFVFCWIIIADKLDYKNAFIRFLSKKAFNSASKKSYAMYLITPVVATLICGLTKSGLTYEFPEMVSDITSINNFNSFIHNPPLSTAHLFLCDHQNLQPNFFPHHCTF